MYSSQRWSNVLQVQSVFQRDLSELIPPVKEDTDCQANFQSLEFLVENYDYAENFRA